MGKLTVSFLALCLTALPALAGVDRSTISADAQWLVHLDVHAALNSQLFGALQDREPDLDFENNPDLQEVKDRLGFDPTKDIDSVTAYGLSHDPEAVVVMIHTRGDVDDILTRLSVLAKRTSIEVDGLDISRWSNPEQAGDQVYSYVARHADSDERIVLLSPDANDLVTGIEALRGESSSLEDSDSDLGMTTSAGAIVSVSATGKLAEWADVEPASNIVKLVRSAVVEIGEKGDSSYAHVRVETASAGDATRVTQIIQGAMALASMASEVEEELKDVLPLLQSLKFSAEGPILTIHFEKNTTELIDLMDGAVSKVSREDFKVSKKPKTKTKKPATGSSWY